MIDVFLLFSGHPVRAPVARVGALCQKKGREEESSVESSRVERTECEGEAEGELKR